MSSEHSASFLERIAATVGPAHLFTDDDHRERYARTTLPQGTTPLGIAMPANEEEAQAVVQAAAEHGIPIYPTSSGRNWGYGDACAPRPNCLLIDLSRMNRILEVSVASAYAVVEPGVTQGQLSKHLISENIPLWMDATGAGPDASLVGNVLERGFGHSPYGDRYAHSCAFRVILADGSVINTGFGPYENARAKHLYKWGIGPSLDGLFTQSSFGLVTRMTIWLMPKPESVSYYFLALSEEGAMADLADRLRPLFLSGTLRNVLHCANAHRMLCSSTRFPWDEADGKRALDDGSPEVYARLAKRFNLMEWSCAGVLMGSCEEVRAAAARLKRALKGMRGRDKFFILTDSLYEKSQTFARWLPPARMFNSLIQDLTKVRWMVELLRGQPSREFLSGAHWRARGTPDAEWDPRSSGSGLIWLGPLLPVSGQEVRNVNQIASKVFKEFGFEYQVTFSFTNERCLCAIMSISFDHRNLEECERAAACELALLKSLLAGGFIPYRGSTKVQQTLRDLQPEYWSQLDRLQHSWDPRRLLSPGRYGS